MKYDSLEDIEIIKLITNGDDAAVEYMIKKYGGIVKREIRAVYLIGAETEDLVQEGLIGLYKAVKDYSPDKGASFSTFATLCVKRQIKSAITASNRQKHKPLNSYVSFYAQLDEDGNYVGDDIADTKTSSDPEHIVLNKEQNSLFYQKLEANLSSFEKKVIKLYLEGHSYADIADKLDKPQKSIDNALSRIRNKLSK